MILPFASLLDAVRQRQSLSVEALASAAEVSPAVVGEILGGRTHANMGVAVRLCQALGLRCADAFHTLSGYPMEPSPIGDVLSYADVRQFDELYDRRRPAAVDLLRDLLLAPLAHGRGAALDPALITELALREDDVVRLHLAYPIALRQAEIRDIALRGRGDSGGGRGLLRPAHHDPGDIDRAAAARPHGAPATRLLPAGGGSALLGDGDGHLHAAAGGVLCDGMEPLGRPARAHPALCPGVQVARVARPGRGQPARVAHQGARDAGRGRRGAGGSPSLPGRRRVVGTDTHGRSIHWRRARIEGLVTLRNQKVRERHPLGAFSHLAPGAP